MAGVGVLVIFVAVFSTFYGAFGLIETRIAKRSAGWALFLAPFLWVALELARTYLITGFPWNLLGYAVRPQGLEQIARVTAVYGLSFLALATSALLAWVMLIPRRRFGWIALFAWLVLLLAGDGLLHPPLAQPEPDVALLVQPNIPLAESRLKGWVPWLNPNPLNALVQRSLAASRAPGAMAKDPPLLIWPEEPAPFYFNRDPVFQGAMEMMAKESHAYVIAGTVTFEGQGTSLPKNSAVILSPDGQVVLQYDKIHLVPFGEYVPWWAFPEETGKITSQVGDFVPGKSIRVAKTPQGTLGVFICYEAIFPQLVRKMAASGAGVLVNISDDGWFGDSSAPYQHFEMARFRAIENGRFMLRATNDGITAIVDPYGRVQDEIPRHQQMILTGNFRYLTEETFYTKHGDVFAWACVVVALGMILALGLAARRASTP